MELLREGLRWIHIVLGFVGLVAFWFPVFARKGGYLHRRAGKVFVWCGYGVTGSAMVSCTVITWGWVRRGFPHDAGPGIAFVAMLAYLAVVTFVILRHSMRVLETKKDRQGNTLDRVFAGAASAASLGIVVLALARWTGSSILLLAMSPIGFFAGRGIRRYLQGEDTSSRAWFYEHMGATLGAGIAFHTAFAVFGASRLFDYQLAGVISVLPWILPTLIGVPAGAVWERYYRRKFGDLPANPAVATSGS